MSFTSGCHGIAPGMISLGEIERIEGEKAGVVTPGEGESMTGDGLWISIQQA